MKFKVALLGAILAWSALLTPAHAQDTSDKMRVDDKTYTFRGHPFLYLGRVGFGQLEKGPQPLDGLIRWRVWNSLLGEELAEFIVRPDPSDKSYTDERDLLMKASFINKIGPAKLRAIKRAQNEYLEDTSEIAERLGVSFLSDVENKKTTSLIPVTEVCLADKTLWQQPLIPDPPANSLAHRFRITTGAFALDFKADDISSRQKLALYSKGELKDELFNSVPFLSALLERARSNSTYCMSNLKYWENVRIRTQRLLRLAKARESRLQNPIFERLLDVAPPPPLPGTNYQSYENDNASNGTSTQ